MPETARRFGAAPRIATTSKAALISGPRRIQPRGRFWNPNRQKLPFWNGRPAVWPSRKYPHSQARAITYQPLCKVFTNRD